MCAFALVPFALLPDIPRSIAGVLNIVIAVYVYRQTASDIRGAEQSGRIVERGGVVSGFATVLGAWVFAFAVAIVASVAILLASGSTGQLGTDAIVPPSSGAVSATPGKAATSPVPVATVSAPSPAVAGSGPLHDDIELEALLPAIVSGRPLTQESYRGTDLFKDLFALTDADVAGVEAELANQRLTIDDVSLAVDGRSQPSDPPYFVDALHFRGIQADQLQARLGLEPGALSLDHPAAGSFSKVTVGGKQVLRGTIAMIDQTSHARGIPYVYHAGEVQFVVVTDDPAWAADALRQLP